MHLSITEDSEFMCNVRKKSDTGLLNAMKAGTHHENAIEMQHF